MMKELEIIGTLHETADTLHGTICILRRTTKTIHYEEPYSVLLVHYEELLVQHKELLLLIENYYSTLLGTAGHC